MQITLKKTLIAGVGLIAALFFFLVVLVPVTRSVNLGLGVTTTYKASLMDILAGKESAIEMVKSQINLKDYVKGAESAEALANAMKAYNQAMDALVAVYKVFAVIGIILFVLTALACIGAFFMKKPRGARLLTIPFFALDIVMYLVVMIFSVVLVATTDMAVGKVEVSTPTVFMYLLGVLMFIAMLVSAGVVKDVVFVGKKEAK